MENCHICGGEFEESDLESVYTRDDGDIDVCSNCRDDMPTCEQCGEYVTSSSELFDDGGVGHCEDCHNEWTDEHDSESFTFDYHSGIGRDDKRNGDRYGIGIEIEKEDGDVKVHETAEELLQRTGWCKERDGSLDGYTGFEVISPILPLMDVKELERQFESIKEIINAKSSSHCGGHIHVSDMKRTPAELLFEVFRGYLPLFYALYPLRIGNDYCITKGIPGYLFDRSRYNAFNVGANTLELRIFPTPNKVETLRWRIELIRFIVNNPESEPEKVLQRIIDERSKLHRLMLEIYDKGQIWSKCQLFVQYSREIERISTSAEIATKISEKINNIK